MVAVNLCPFFVARLTATALQILTEDKERISDLFQKFQIPPVAVAKAALWLSQQQDKNSGAFMETNDIYNRRFKVAFSQCWCKDFKELFFDSSKISDNLMTYNYKILPVS